MAIEAKEATLCIKKVLRFPIRKGYRFVSEHPVLFSLGVLLYLLYRVSPGFFAFLVSSSPVIICTTLLLGILLSYGEVNLPETGENQKATPETSDFKVGNSSSGIHFEANQRLPVPEVRENTSSFKDRETKQTVLVRERVSEHVDLDDDVPLLRRVDEEDERYDRRNIPRALTPFPSMVSLCQEGGAGEEFNLRKERELGNSFLIQNKAYSQTSLFDGAFLSGLDSNDTTFGLFSSGETVNKSGEMEKNLNQERVFPDSVTNEVSEEKQYEDLAGTSKPICPVSSHSWKEKGGLNIDTSNVTEDKLLDSSLGSPWARISSQDDSSGFDSDGAESSSPDASMTDIAPVLDEIDPLLGSNASHPDPVLKDESDIDSHGSEDHQIDDDSNDEGDEDDAQDNVEGKKKEDGKGAAFLWTADDEKNLMDLGYSEMERNRRLELLMARRRSRKNIRFEVDNNLIDVDNNGAGRSLDDLSRFRAHVAPIAVPRRNPFDLPYDLEEAIPGSAPSVLHARKNPFDLPLEQSNESADAHDSSNSGESVMSSHRDMFFRRHESFNFGSTDPTQERRFSRLKPYFVPETVEWSASNLQRQFSDKSESKLSSVAESDVASSVADQEVRKDHDDSYMEHGSPSLLRQYSDLTDAGSECSDGINSVDVELDNSDIDDREIALQHFVFERSQEREAYLASTKGKGCAEDYTLRSAGNSTMSFHAVPDLLSWEDGDGDGSLGAKPSFESNTGVDCSEWVSSSRSVDEVVSGSGDIPSYLDTEVGSSSNTIVLGASNPSEKDRDIDFMSYPNNEMPLDNLIHGSVELPSEFINETLPVISRDLHPIPEERVVENFNIQEKHETAIFTDPAAAVTGLLVIEEHFDVGSDGSLSSAVIAQFHQADDTIRSPSSGAIEISYPFAPMAAEPNLVTVDDMKEEAAVEYLLDSDDETGKVYPEPMEDSEIDESFLTELDTVGDFSVEPMGLDQQAPDHASHSDSHANGNGVAADPVISPQTSDNISLTMSDSLGSREQSPSVDHINDSEFSWSFEVSHGDPEQTVYNPRRRILEGSPIEAMDTELKPPQSDTEMLSGDTPTAAIFGDDSSDMEVGKNESMTAATDPDITVIDSNSPEDIENAFKHVSDGVDAEVSTNTETSNTVGVDMDSKPKVFAGQLHIIDAKSVDDIHAALKEHSDPVVNSPLEENERKGGYRDTAESTKHDTPEPVQAKIQLSVGDGKEAPQQLDSTSNTSSSEAKTHGDFDTALKELEADSARSTVQAMEHQGKKENEQQ